MAANSYDEYNTNNPLGDPNPLHFQGNPWMHDQNYGSSTVYRGNATVSGGLGAVIGGSYMSVNGPTFPGQRITSYGFAGIPWKVKDADGREVNIQQDSTTNYSLPSVLTPGTEANLATSVGYSSSFAVTSVTGPNGANATTTYDSYGRPLSSKSADGSTTTYAYAFNPNTQTATLGDYTTDNPPVLKPGYRWKTTTMDGFGRTIKVETGHDTTTVSMTETEYAPCACSPLGKLYRTSMPHIPNANPVWTVYHCCPAIS